jgi:xanthine dehydrogenase YagS FAD-binding subunit
MRPFIFDSAATPREAIETAQAWNGGTGTTHFLAGGTTLIDLMKLDVMRPERLIDINPLSSSDFGRISIGEGGLWMGALVHMADAAEHPDIVREFPAVAQSLQLAASQQIRNMATLGGNLMQRTRCLYFYDDAARCNKRQPGAGCDARDGFNRMHAILGASDACVATHPSDLCVALAALDATVHLQGADGARTVHRSLPFEALHRLPGDTPDKETELRPGELITAIELPALPLARRSTYRKVRDRSSYAFALVSVAAALEVSDGKVRDVRLALGGVAHRPWRAHAAEAVLRGATADASTFRRAAEAELAAARPLRDNGFKVELAKRTIVAVLGQLAGQLAGGRA